MLIHHNVYKQRNPLRLLCAFRYNEKLHVYNANIASAVRYSDLVKPIVDVWILNGKENLTDTIELFRSMIQNRYISKPSLKMATWYYDNMTLYVDLILVVQNNLAYAIIKMLDDRTNLVSTGVVVSSIIILIIIIMCPLLVRMVRSLTNDIQNYAITLVEKTKELKKEKKKTDTLFYQMLPKSVGEKLKKHKNFTAQYHKEVSCGHLVSVDGVYCFVRVKKMGNVVHRAGIEPTLLAVWAIVLTVTPPRLSDVIDLSMCICLCDSLSDSQCKTLRLFPQQVLYMASGHIS